MSKLKHVHLQKDKIKKIEKKKSIVEKEDDFGDDAMENVSEARNQIYKTEIIA